MPYVAQVEESDSVVRRLVKEVGTISAHGLDSETMTRCAARPIGIVLSEGFSLLCVGIVTAIFNRANQLAVARNVVDWMYTLKMLSLSGGSVACSSSVRLWTERFDADRFQNYDVLFIGGGKRLQNGLQNALADDTLPGLTSSFDRPGFGGHGEADNDEDCFSSMASALMLVKCDLGHDIAREVGEQVLPGATAKLALLLAEAGVMSVHDKVRSSARWLKDNCERPISIADAAQVAAMSERNYQRRFKDEIGVTPSEYLLRARLDMVCRLLTETDLPVDKIARRIGMANGDRLAKIFRRRMLVSPTEYRLQNRQAQASS